MFLGTLQCKIVIDDKYVLRGAHEIEIKKTVFSIIETCTIKTASYIIPVNEKTNYKGERVKFSKYLKKGMKISVEIGHDTRPILKEFEGYVVDVDDAIPISIKCIGFVYELQYQNLPKLSFKETTLKEILQHIISGTNLTLDPDIPEVVIKKYRIGSESLPTGAHVLEDLRDNYLLSTYMKGCVLYVGLLTKIYGSTKYVINRNTLRPTSLKWNEFNEDVKITIRVNDYSTGKTVAFDSDNKAKKSIELKGHSYLLYNKEFAEKLALNQKEIRLSGGLFSGCFETLLIPYAEPAYKAIIETPETPYRNGTYYISTVITTFGINGTRREIQLGHKLYN